MILQKKQDEKTIIITRIFDAPRELVWKAWTEPEHIAQWWGPKGLTTKVTKFDFRPGGKWRYVMIRPDGGEMPLEGTFSEITEPERIVTSDDSSYSNGFVNTMVFEELPDNKTKFIFSVTHLSVEDKEKNEEMNVKSGWNSNFDSLEEYLRQMPGL